jgi:hypothetical protein
MSFDLSHSLDLLARTPAALDALLRGLAVEWVDSSEGGDRWSVREVVAHLVHCEQTNFIVRAETLLQDNPEATLPPFDRFGQRATLTGLPINELLDLFAGLRHGNVRKVRDWHLSAQQLDSRGMHPELGTVTLRQLLATWTAHDLTHVSQISRALAARQRGEVGPWIQNLRVLRSE